MIGSAGIYIVDGDEGFSVTLAALLAHTGVPVYEFATPEAFLGFVGPKEAISALSGCLIVEVRLRGGSGFDFHHSLKRSGCRLPIIYITAHGDVRMAVRAMKDGAVDFFVKPIDEQSVVDAVNVALARERHDGAAARQIAADQENFAQLDRRERQILVGITQGRLNKQIAADAGLSEVTIKVYRARVMAKMQARTVPELIRIALRLGLSGDDAGGMGGLGRHFGYS